MAGAAPEGIAGETAQLATLKERLKGAKDRVARLVRWRRTWLLLASVTGFVGAVTIINPSIVQFLILPDNMPPDFSSSLILGNTRLFGLATMTYGGFFFGMSFLVVDVRRAELDAKEIEDEIDLLQMRSASLEQKAHKLLRIQQGQLERFPAELNRGFPIVCERASLAALIRGSGGTKSMPKP